MGYWISRRIEDAREAKVLYGREAKALWEALREILSKEYDHWRDDDSPKGETVPGVRYQGDRETHDEDGCSHGLHPPQTISVDIAEGGLAREIAWCRICGAVWLGGENHHAPHANWWR